MNVSRCAGCGDQHLCAGALSAQLGPALTEQVAHFIDAVFVPDPLGVVGTNAAFEAYVAWCADTGTVPYSQRRFVAAVAASPGVRRVKRSTMRFVGLTWKRSQTRGRHAAPESVGAGTRAASAAS